MAKTSKTSGNKGSASGKAPTAMKKAKATTGGETGAPVTAATASTLANAVKAKGASTGAAKTPEATHIAPTVITSEERHRLIAEAAYLLAEKRGFQGGNAQQDWYEAAAQIDRMIMGTNKGSGT